MLREVGAHRDCDLQRCAHVDAAAPPPLRWLFSVVNYNGETVFVNTCRVPLHRDA